MKEAITIQIRHAPIRFLLLGLSGICLIAALWGGLVRLGWWDFSPLIGGLPGVHGPLIVCGFLGTFFALERAVSSGNFASYLVPLLTALGAMALVVQPTSNIGPKLVVLGSLAFFALCLVILARKRTLYSLFMLLGSVQWVLGNIIWLLGWPVYNVTLWWMSFVVLTTAGERLEISKMIHISVGPWIILLIGLGAVFVGHILVAVGHLTAPENVMDLYQDAIFDPRIKLGMKVAGVGMIVSSIWFLIYDAARSFLGRSGLSGYIAFCMVSSYVWLTLSGVFSFTYAGLVSGPTYDAFIHVFFLGFLMSMIFGHGPVLLSSMLGLFINTRKYFYVGPVLLHVSLLSRVSGDLMDSSLLRKWGGMLNAVAIVYFLLALFYTLLKDKLTESSGENSTAG